MKKIIIIVVLVVVLAGGGFLAYTLLSGPKEVVLTPFTLDPGDAFVTNIKDTSSYLKADLIIEVADDRLKTDLEEKNDVVRNDIIFVLRSLSADQLKGQNVETLLSKAITDKLNAEFETDSFTRVYFNEYVIQ